MTAQDPPTLRHADIARLLNVSNERARQITNGDNFPPPVLMGPPRTWDCAEVEAWIEDVNWRGRYPWRKPVGEY